MQPTLTDPQGNMKAILKTDQTATPNADILGTDWYGEYQLLCTTYDAAEVVLQVRVPDGDWINARYDGTEIKLTAAGDTLDVKLAKAYEYRLSTETAGAEVYIAAHDPHGS